MSAIRLDAIEPGGFGETEMLVDGVAESVILHRAGNEVRGWLNICPHAGRRLDWAPGQFLKSREGLLVCAVHGASFELEAGRCIAGPCRGDRLRAVAMRCVDGEVRLLAENQSVYVPLGSVHRMENPGKVDMVLIEVQTGVYLGEDDIIRYDDVYARN